MALAEVAGRAQAWLDRRAAGWAQRQPGMEARASPLAHLPAWAVAPPGEGAAAAAHQEEEEEEAEEAGSE